MTSSVIDTGNGTYMITAGASPIRGGATGATNLAYADANKFCAGKGGGLHAVVLDNAAKDVYQGSLTGGVYAAGRTDLHFRCGN